MGTDILGVVETMQGGKWKHVSFIDTLCRDYRTFAVIACVKPSFGPGWGREATGVPSDVDHKSSIYIPNEFADDYDGPHDSSSLNLDELFSLLQKTGMLNRWMSVLEESIEKAGYNLDELVLSDFRLVFWFVG